MELFHPKEPSQIKNISKMTGCMDARLLTSTQNEMLRAKQLKNACFLNIHDLKFIKIVSKADSV